MEFQTILFSVENGTALITINRADKMNALNREVITEMSRALDAVYTRTDIRSAIITGAGAKAFVAGADISEFTSLDGAGGEALSRYGQEHLFNKVENCPKPIIAAVNGFSLGGGCELAMACHFRVASENAKFGQPEVNLGLIPGYGGTQRLAQLIGKGKAMEISLTAGMLNAQEALHYGLVNYVVTSDELLPKCYALCETINTKAPLALAQIIACMNKESRGNDGFEAEIKAFGALFDTADMREGVTAFLEKRKATFTGH